MKRLTLILLICIYGFSAFGIGLKQFYCCGELKSVVVSLVEHQSGKGNKETDNDRCCKTKYHYFKVKDSHHASGDIQAPAKQYTEHPGFLPTYQPSKALLQPVAITNSSHAPPLYTTVPRFLSNCVFRI